MKRIVVLILLSVLIFSLALAEEDFTSEGMEMRIFTVWHGSPEELVPVIEQMKSPGGRVSAHANSNNIIVYDHPYVLNQIENIIGQLDTRQKQVDIKVLVVETSATILRGLGIASSEAILSPERFSEIRYLINQSVQTNTSSEMTLKTLSGSPAVLTVAAEEIYPGTVFHTDGLTFISPERERAAGSFLEVTSKVNNDGTIMVKISPKVSDFTGDYGTSERTLLTQVVVNSGDTIALGGVNVASQRTVQSNLPLTGLSASATSNEPRSTLMFLTVNASE
jgi:type II secretory pathway component GspD/PulD (secretin)